MFLYLRIIKRMLILSLFPLAGCTQVLSTLVNVPAKILPDYDKLTDLVFDQERNLALDLYRPQNIEEGEYLPVVVFLYGGGWHDGGKSQYTFVADALTELGLIVVIPNYRLYPEVNFPEFIEDNAQALKMVFDQLDVWQGDKNRVYLMGHSAGAYNAAMLAADPSYLQSVNLSDKNIKGVVGLAGPYHFTPKKPIYRKIFKSASENNYQSMMVDNYVTGNAPAMLLMHGLSDDTVNVSNTEILAHTISALGGAVEVKTYKGVGHMSIIGGLAPLLRHASPVYRDLKAYFQQQLDDY